MDRGISQAVTELPAARTATICPDYGLPEYDAAILTASKAMADYFEVLREAVPSTQDRE